MKTLLTSIQAYLKAQLTYIKDVTIVPDFLIFPEEVGFPQICLLDNGEEQSDKEKGARLERLKVSIGFYQAILESDIGASVIGSGSEKGTIDIKDDTMDALRSKTFSGGYQAPRLTHTSKSQALENKDYTGFVAFKFIELEYPNEVVEAT